MILQNYLKMKLKIVLYCKIVTVYTEKTEVHCQSGSGYCCCQHDNFVKSLFRQHEHGNDFCREAIIHLGFPPSTNPPKEVITVRLQKMLQAVPKVDNNIPDIPHMFLSSLKSLIQSSSVLNEHFSILKDIVDSLHQNKYVADLGDPWYEF